MDDFFLDSQDSAFWQEPDFLLSMLVSFIANKMSIDFGVTLMVRGTIITGSLVGEREYLENMQQMFRTMLRSLTPSANEADMSILDDALNFSDLTEDAYLDEDEDFDEDDFDDEDFEPTPIRFLHLRNPFVLYPGAAMSFGDPSLPIMRIRLSEVDAWIPGRANITAQDDMDDAPYPPNKFTQ